MNKTDTILAKTPRWKLKIAWHAYWRIPWIRAGWIALFFGQSKRFGSAIHHIVGPADVGWRCYDCGAIVPKKSRVDTGICWSIRDSTIHGWARFCENCTEKRLQKHYLLLKQDYRQSKLRLQELRSMPYEEYLQTDEWDEKRRRALWRADYKCELCNSNGKLHVHHKTYERRGEERNKDLIVLCENCHKTHHNVLGLR